MNRTEYIGKLNALYVGEKNCLEELITIYDEKDQEIERLKNIIKEVREYLNKNEIEEVYLDCKLYETKVYKDILEILDKENR